MGNQSFVGIPTNSVANEQKLRQGDRVSYPAFQVSIKGPKKSGDLLSGGGDILFFLPWLLNTKSLFLGPYWSFLWYGHPHIYSAVVHRLKTRCRLSLDDYVLMFGVACLSAVIGILYRFT